MKNNILNFALAGIVGGLMAVFVLKFGQTEKTTTTTPNAQFVSQTLSEVNSRGDFVEASKNATQAVVHIYAEESKQTAQNRSRKNQRDNPFGDVFGSDFFKDFFQGSPFQNQYRQQRGAGSGVIISPDGYIVTNNHVVGFADNLVVTLNDGRKVNATRVGTDPSTDLAVIKIEMKDRLKTIPYADSDKVNVGEWVLAVGNPFSYLTSTVTAGIVSAKGRDLDIIKGEKTIEEFIQTDAVVNPGNSGGALINANGRLIGINTAIASPTGAYAGYSFAIPSNMVKRIVADIIENGDIERVNLGIGGYDVNDQLVKEFDLKTNKGFYIGEINRGSSAQLAGILPGDVLIALNGKKVDNYEDIKEIVKYSKAGDKITAKVNRKGKELMLSVKLRKHF